MFSDKKNTFNTNSYSYRSAIRSRMGSRWRRWASVTLLIASCILFWRNINDIDWTASHEPERQVYNRTLGFQTVFAVGFPHRTDKRDAVTLASAVTGFDVEWEKGVAFEDIDRKAAPALWDFEQETKGALGCWRAHMNIMQRIVRENIQTALVIEDDGDWDVSLKDQLLELAYGTRSLIGELSTSRDRSAPYGVEWDYMWIGHCRVGPTDQQTNFYTIPNDHTVPPTNVRRARWRNYYVPKEVLSNSTRLVFKAYAGMCTQAYAVTQAGARRMLATIGLHSLSSPVDVSLSAMCRQKTDVPFRCLGVYPPLFASHRAAGPKSRDSDLNTKGPGDHPEYTFDIAYSVIRNLPRLVGRAHSVTAQWPDMMDYPEIEWPPTKPYERKGHMANINLRSQGRQEIKGINV